MDLTHVSATPHFPHLHAVPRERRGYHRHVPIYEFECGSCGFLASEGGLGYTWAGNSQQYRLTPWSNDPVSDPSGEVFYVRDEEDGSMWSVTPGPAGGSARRALAVLEASRRGGRTS